MIFALQFINMIFVPHGLSVNRLIFTLYSSVVGVETMLTEYDLQSQHFSGGFTHLGGGGCHSDLLC